jgi:DNA-binding CsgD family transcriptional regulator
MTMANGSPILPSTEAPAGNSRVLTWTAAAQIEHRPGRGVTDRPCPPDGAAIARAADVRAELREAASAAAEAAARARSVAELLDEALAALTGADIAPVRVPISLSAARHEGDRLSAREREVLVLVAEGRTNKAIAEALFVSPNTVKTHVTSLLHKLRVDSRVQLAAIATTQGLHHRAVIGVGTV